MQLNMEVEMSYGWGMLFQVQNWLEGIHILRNSMLLYAEGNLLGTSAR